MTDTTEQQAVAQDLNLCSCIGDEDDRPLTIKIRPSGAGQICCDECGMPVIDDEPKTWRELAEAAIADLGRYADDELPHRRNVSYTAYWKRFELLDRLASVSSASAEPRKDSVAFVQEWLMNADYDPSQFDKDFAAAIDARHGFDDAAVTAIAERFCAAPLPDTVCADMVAIKPMAGRSGTNLMTVAEAKAILRSILPEPVPATNQAGEVEHRVSRWRKASVALGGWLSAALDDPKVCAEMEADIQEWFSAGEPFAALATQPATSQEGEGVSVSEYNEAHDKVEEVVGGAFRDGFKEGWLYSRTPNGADYDEHEEEYGRAVDIEPSEAWDGYRDKYVAMLPVPALPTLKSEGSTR